MCRRTSEQTFWVARLLISRSESARSDVRSTETRLFERGEGGILSRRSRRDRKIRLVRLMKDSKKNKLERTMMDIYCERGAGAASVSDFNSSSISAPAFFLSSIVLPSGLAVYPRPGSRLKGRNDQVSDQEKRKRRMAKSRRAKAGSEEKKPTNQERDTEEAIDLSSKGEFPDRWGRKDPTKMLDPSDLFALDA